MLIPTRISQYLPVALFTIFLIFYGATAAPSIVELFDDTLEFQLVAPTFGIAHPTGYPLYTIVGGLWSRFLFPFGNWAWRMNLLSALFGAATLSILFRIGYHLTKDRHIGPHPWLSLLSVVTFGLGPVWWSQATVAEIYTLHNLFVVSILYITLQIPRRDLALPITHRRFLLLFSLVGLSLTHHRTTVLLLPGIALYLLCSQPALWRPRRIWLKWFAFLLTPLLLYLYLPIRASMGAIDLNNSYANTWQGFQAHILAEAYLAFFQDNALAVQFTYGDWVRLFQEQMGFVGLGFGFVGIGGLLFSAVGQIGRRGVVNNSSLTHLSAQQHRDWWLILYIFAASLFFALYYRVHDIEVFLLPAFLCLSLFISIGAYLISRGIHMKMRWDKGDRLSAIRPYAPWLYLSLLILLLFGIGGRGSISNRSQTWAAHDYAVAMAKVNFPPQSRVIGLEGEMSALKYMQQAEGLGENATPLVADGIEQRRRLVAQSVTAGWPTYLTREVAGIGERYSFSGMGPLIRVWPRGQSTVGLPSHPVAVPMVDGALQLNGYDVEPLAQAGGLGLRVTLYWQPLRPLTQRLKVSLRLQDSVGEPWLDDEGRPLVADRFPLRQAAYTDQWLPNELIQDVHTIDLPTSVENKNSRPAPTKLLLIVYDADTVAEVGRWLIEWEQSPSSSNR